MRVATFAVVLALTTLLMSSVAFAEPTWCEEDPVFVVNGLALDVTTGFPLANIWSVDAVDFDLQVPQNVTAAAQLTIPSWVPITTTITRSLDTWTGGPIPVIATVKVHARDDFDIRTRVSGTYGALVSTIPGTSNKKQSFTFYLGQ